MRQKRGGGGGGCCEGEITAGLCKCQKVMKNASSGQETRCFSGVSALLAGSEEPN